LRQTSTASCERGKFLTGRSSRPGSYER